MSSILKYLNFKYGIDKFRLNFEALQKIATYEHISVQWLDPKRGNTSGLICWGEGSTRLEHPIIFLRGKKREESANDPYVWFTLAHELAHYFLQPYLKYLDLSHGKKEKLPSVLSDLHGFGELEADQFATSILIPTENVSKKFEDLVIEALLTPNRDEKVKKLTESIYNHYCEETKKLPGMEKIDKKIERNLMVKSHRFVEGVREKIILYYKKFSKDVALEKMDENDKRELFENIKTVIRRYEE